mmetsp:Transcript_10576/g.13757  ORF Transcript_10576/g.13757 Transcript_10576/m.13757 type:complete len:513 (-) Transcript_10576:193-1731(-)
MSTITTTAVRNSFHTRKSIEKYSSIPSYNSNATYMRSSTNSTEDLTYALSSDDDSDSYDSKCYHRYGLSKLKEEVEEDKEYEEDSLSGQNDVRKFFPIKASVPITEESVCSSEDDYDYSLVRSLSNDCSTVVMENHRSSSRDSPTSTIRNGNQFCNYDGSRKMSSGSSSLSSQGFKLSSLWSGFMERSANAAQRYREEKEQAKRHRQRRPSTFLQSSQLPTPLYEAVSMNAKLYVLRRLIAVFPEAVRIPNCKGCLPLHCAIEKYDTSVEVITLLLSADPSTSNVKNKEGKSPMDLLWKRYVRPEKGRSKKVHDQAEEIRRTMEQVIINKSFIATFSDTFKTFWMLFLKFMSASFGACLPIHGVLKLENPEPLLVQFVCTLFPQHLAAHEPHSGFTPLHLLANKEGIHDGIVVNYLRILNIILSVHPMAVTSKDSRGRTPLNLGIRSGKPWLVLKLMSAADPNVLRIPDSSTGVAPFMLASLVESNKSSLCIDTSTVFSLLKSDPKVLEMYI